MLISVAGGGGGGGGPEVTLRSISGWDASPLQGSPPSIKFAGTHLYTWVERGTVRVECLCSRT